MQERRHQSHYTRRYCGRYDAMYDMLFAVWLEPKCNDPDCEYCSNRPNIHPKDCVACSDYVHAEQEATET